MRLTDNRYASERSQFELALRMIGHEARTHTIRVCTGLSDDRIRKLYTTYFRDSGHHGVKRRRGKSPQQVGLFVKNPANQLEATTLVALFCTGLLVRIDTRHRMHACWPRPDVEYGHRVCRAYETYRLLHRQPRLSFEWAWSLLQSITSNDELLLSTCRRCGGSYVQDAFALDQGVCPACGLAQQQANRRRSAANAPKSSAALR